MPPPTQMHQIRTSTRSGLDQLELDVDQIDPRHQFQVVVGRLGVAAAVGRRHNPTIGVRINNERVILRSPTIGATGL